MGKHTKEELIYESGVPDWLQPPKHHPSDFYTEWTWEETLRRLSEGETLKSICNDDSMPSRGEYIKWIYKKDERKKRYHEAQTLAAEAFNDDNLHDLSSDVDDNGAPLNLELIKQRIAYRKFVMGAWSKHRWSEKPHNQVQVELNMNTMALDALRLREVPHVIEHDPEPALLENDDED